jgi:hypothetical protein
MKQLIWLILLMALFFTIILLAGCGGGGGDSEGDGTGSNLGTIDARYEAEDAVITVRAAVDDGVLAHLSNGTFSGSTVNGITGTATVTGTEASTSNVSCGYDCIRSTYDADVTIVFSDFKFNYASNNAVTLTGSVDYTEHYTSTQSGLNYTSSRSITVHSNGPVQYLSWIDLTTGDYGYQDTITFNATGDSDWNFSGTLTNNAGVTFSL